MTNKEMLMEIMNSVGTINKRLDGIEQRVNSLEKAPSKTSTSKKGASKKEKDTRTWTEKKAEYASQFSEAERKAYGEAKKAAREAQKKAYEMTNQFFKDKGFVGKSVWRKKYNEILATL